jgi:transposase-like protein DUF772
LLLQVFYGIRSERQHNLLYRWFVGLSPDDLVWDPTVFTKNRDRLQNGEVLANFMTKLLNHPQVKPLLSDEHFSVGFPQPASRKEGPQGMHSGVRVCCPRRDRWIAVAVRQTGRRYSLCGRQQWLWESRATETLRC